MDLAWSSNGYVYHTRLDTVEQVPKAALQRTGDNVLALAHGTRRRDAPRGPKARHSPSSSAGLLTSEELERPVDPESRQPVFFDVLGQWVVCARADKAALAAGTALLLVLLRVQLNARLARRERERYAGRARERRAAFCQRDCSCAVYMSAGAWWRGAARALLALGAAHAAGLLAALGVAAALHALRARLAFYAQPLLLAPLYALPGRPRPQRPRTPRASPARPDPVACPQPCAPRGWRR